MKILVLGLSGAGKSTWAQQLGAGYQAPVLHLDQVHWLPGWAERDLDEERQIVRDFMDAHDSWVIEGGYSDVEFERRLTEADRIYILLAPRFVRLWRIGRRWLRHRGSSRPSMAEGCPETLDAAFVRWVLWDGCNKRRMDALRTIATTHPHKTVLYRWWR